MKRRHFLKLAAALPFVGPLIAKVRPEPKVEVAEDFRLDRFWIVDSPRKRGELTILLGFPKTGKTTLAKDMCHQSSHRPYLFDDADSFTDPQADVTYLLDRGIDVVAVMSPPPNYLGKHVYEALVKGDHLDFVSASRTRLMFYQASRVILIKRFKWQVDDAKNPKTINFDWTCISLKNRYAETGKEWLWHASLPFSRWV